MSSEWRRCSAGGCSNGGSRWTTSPAGPSAAKIFAQDAYFADPKTRDLLPPLSRRRAASDNLGCGAVRGAPDACLDRTTSGGPIDSTGRHAAIEASASSKPRFNPYLGRRRYRLRDARPRPEPNLPTTARLDVSCAVPPTSTTCAAVSHVP